MNQPFQVSPDSIQAALQLLYPLCYTLEEMNEMQWNIDLCDDPDKFDITLAYNAIGGFLPSKADHKDIN